MTVDELRQAGAALAACQSIEDLAEARRQMGWADEACAQLVSGAWAAMLDGQLRDEELVRLLTDALNGLGRAHESVLVAGILDGQVIDDPVLGTCLALRNLPAARPVPRDSRILGRLLPAIEAGHWPALARRLESAMAERGTPSAILARWQRISSRTQGVDMDELALASRDLLQAGEAQRRMIGQSLDEWTGSLSELIAFTADMLAVHETGH